MNYSQSNKEPARPPLRYLSPLHRATRSIQEHFARWADGLGVEANEAHLVSYLASYGPVPIGDLVKVFGVKKSTLTGVLDRMEQRELVTRTVNPDDRRSFHVELTASGEAAADSVRIMLEGFENALDDELTDADRAAFGRLMEAIARVTGAAPIGASPSESGDES